MVLRLNNVAKLYTVDQVMAKLLGMRADNRFGQIIKDPNFANKLAHKNDPWQRLLLCIVFLYIITNKLTKILNILMILRHRF